ncbi:pyridoxamine 5'-phosphate oxidase [Massilia sp. Root351]|uniref:pyridoxamine 5'-phosphate oxidase family protein n=1 Tax=Massilia sp. Root351 TaxID=1736522 RepID=UPI0007107EE7|nr:pyridoxamine 5'-phosphate oxidase family protein [Massilia sp. Root351]KQV87193.1 pyridoxamine 5'-phosphate oxidase [Massilia sp. Root351]
MDSPVSDTVASPWHAGEVALQRSSGMAERMDALGRKVVRGFMPDQHREFFAQLPFVVLGAVDPAGDVWATLRAGCPGFLHSPDPLRLQAALPREPLDPADAGMEHGNAVGLLGIELHTRRRNRMNGVLRRSGDAAFEIGVQQSFGNCPQYIQLRDYAFSEQAPDAPEQLAALDDAARALIAGADSFYVATYADLAGGERQVDVSHRGGRPGFVRLDPDGGLTIPDFQGNMFFNTLGNIALNRRAGLVFVDFASGSLLQMSGTAELLEGPAAAPGLAVFEGAQRLWRFQPQRVVRRAAALPLRWIAQDNGASPAALRTGAWQ